MRRLWRRRSTMLCMLFTFFAAVWLVTSVAILKLQDSYQTGYLHSDSMARADEQKNDGRRSRGDAAAIPGVQVVVGYYEGNLPGVKKQNYSQDELNANRYNPVRGMGEMGRPVKLNVVQEVQGMKLFGINQFNLVASDLIAVNRSLPDMRSEDCRQLIYSDHLPSASVVIVFHNEAWSTLVRTVISVINRSPRRLLREIILVDDASNREFLREALDDYVSQLMVPTTVIRSKQRIGLVKARLLGAKRATGQVLIFLDSHCECTTGWIEPLLSRIKEDRTDVVCPVIDVINEKTFQLQKGIETYRGGFNWKLQFRWYSPTQSEIRAWKQDITAPMKTPTMAGGLFAIEKTYFEEMGTYDDQMKIWGGENLEMSFRIWQCGGRLEIMPCSHVGHVFRKVSPHDFPPEGSSTVLNTNLVRVAEVWMDEWRSFIYKTSPVKAKLAESVDVTARKQLRQRLGCKSFAWYLDNVWPGNFLPKNDTFFGRIQNLDSGMCVSKQKNAQRKNCKLHMETCSLGFDAVQMWLFSTDGSVRSDEHICLSAKQSKYDWSLVATECAEVAEERWTYNSEEKNLIHRFSRRCLSFSKWKDDGEKNSDLTLSWCDDHRVNQQWTLQPFDWKEN